MENALLAYLKTRKADFLLDCVEKQVDTDFGRFLKQYVVTEKKKAAKKQANKRRKKTPTPVERDAYLDMIMKGIVDPY